MKLELQFAVFRPLRIGQRNGYVLALSDAYRMAALWHGQKEKSAKAKARKDGIPWRRARLEFLRANRIV